MLRCFLIILSFSLCITVPAISADTATEEKPLAPTAAVVSVQKSFLIEPLAANVFAAIAKPGSQATTNALFVIGTEYVVAAGAHMSRPVIEDLRKAISARTQKPLRYFVLTHHHAGFTYVDFDFPPGQDVLMSWQTWKSIDGEIREPEYTSLYFNEGLTLNPGGLSVVLSNIGNGHTDGDVLVYIPEEQIVFTSDLLYINSVGYMGSGYMTEWLLALDFIEQIGARHIVPGYGPISDTEGIYEFSQFFRTFLTEILQHIEKGDSLEQTLATFDLPEYNHLEGYGQLIELNIRRAYEDLNNTFN